MSRDQKPFMLPSSGVSENDVENTVFYLLAYLSVFKVFSQEAIPGEMVAICAGKQGRDQCIRLIFSYVSLLFSHHACSGVFSYEGVPQHLG